MNWQIPKPFSAACSMNWMPSLMYTSNLSSWTKSKYPVATSSIAGSMSTAVIRTWKVNQVKLFLCFTWRHIGGAEVLLHSFLTLALDGGEWSVSGPSHFITRERSPDMHRRRSWVGHTASPEMPSKKPLLHLPRIEPHPAHNLEFCISKNNDTREI